MRETRVCTPFSLAGSVWTKRASRILTSEGVNSKQGVGKVHGFSIKSYKHFIFQNFKTFKIAHPYGKQRAQTTNCAMLTMAAKLPDQEALTYPEGPATAIEQRALKVRILGMGE